MRNQHNNGLVEPRSNAVAVIIFALLWTIGIACIDIDFYPSLQRQVRSGTYAQTIGTVVSSTVKTEWLKEYDKIQNRYVTRKYDKAQIVYAYAVPKKASSVNVEIAEPAQQFTAKRISYLDDSILNGDSFVADSFSQQHPPDSQITVFYDPASPTNATLIAGVDGQFLLALMLLMPFHAVMFGFWFAAASRWRVYTSAMQRFEAAPGCALSVLGVLALILDFGILFFLGSRPSGTVMISAWVLLLSSTAIAFRGIRKSTKLNAESA